MLFKIIHMSLHLYINKALHLFELMRVRTKRRVVYLTFDDGPDDGITEFVLNELKKYNAKATFFCVGACAEKHPYLLKRILDEGHVIGNHTYSHSHGFQVDSRDYIKDVELANNFLKTRLFRPPFGALKFGQFIRLFLKYRIVYWSLISGDSDLDDFEYKKSMKRLKKTKKGDIVLFHFCKLHQDETSALLPRYLQWLEENSFVSCAL